MNILDKVFRGKDGKVAAFQLPNIPLWVWIVFTILAHILPKSLAQLCGVAALVAILTWAVMEMYAGSSLFRRLLGVVVFVVAIVNRF